MDAEMTQGADATVPPGAQFRRDLRDLLGREVARIGRFSGMVQE
jgi:hypothetical protein